MSLIAQRFRALYVSLIVAFLLYGTALTILGASLPRILSDFSWSYGVAGAVIAASALAYFLGTLAAGRVLKRLGSKATSSLGLFLSAVGLAFFAASPSPALNIGLNALIGFGQGLIEPTFNWAVIRMDERGTGRAMTLMHGAYSLGAVAGPMLLGIILGAGVGWTLLYRAIAALFAALAVLLAFLPFGALGGGRASATVAAERRSKPRRRPIYWLGFACLLFYVGTEQGLTNWIAEYFVRVFHAAPTLAAGMVSLFWIGLLAGRFGAPALYRGARQDALVSLSSALLVVAVLALNLAGFLARRDLQLWLGPPLVFLIGLGCSVIYPVAVSLVGASSADDQEGAVSFAVAGGGLGLFAFPFLVAGLSQGWGIRAGFVGYAVLAALTALATFALAAAFRRAMAGRGR